jgi:hypothetical protein
MRLKIAIRRTLIVTVVMFAIIVLMAVYLIINYGFSDFVDSHLPNLIINGLIVVTIVGVVTFVSGILGLR